MPRTVEAVQQAFSDWFDAFTCCGTCVHFEPRLFDGYCRAYKWECQATDRICGCQYDPIKALAAEFWSAIDRFNEEEANAVS